MLTSEITLRLHVSRPHSFLWKVHLYVLQRGRGPFLVYLCPDLENHVGTNRTKEDH